MQARQLANCRVAGGLTACPDAPLKAQFRHGCPDYPSCAENLACFRANAAKNICHRGRAMQAAGILICPAIPNARPYAASMHVLALRGTGSNTSILIGAALARSKPSETSTLCPEKILSNMAFSNLELLQPYLTNRHIENSSI